MLNGSFCLYILKNYYSFLFFIDKEVLFTFCFINKIIFIELVDCGVLFYMILLNVIKENVLFYCIIVLKY